MNVAVQLEFKAERKEPLGALVRRVLDAFGQAGLRPDVIATFSDGPGILRKTSAVDRALRKYPHLAPFERNDAPLNRAGIPAVRRLTNADAERAFAMDDVLVLADAVPRSLPFHGVSLHLAHEDFGVVQGLPAGLAPRTGIAIADSWWVNGRSRSLSALYAIEGDPASRRLPDPPDGLRAIFASLGKPRRSEQFVTSAIGAAVVSSGAASPVPAAGSTTADLAAIGAIVARYRAEMSELIARIGLPHDLPSPLEARRTSLGASGPLKPTLVNVFKPRGYVCRGGSGTFTLRRKTPGNLVAELELDVGTWSRSLTFMFRVRGPGFNATLIPPVTTRGGGQYPIGDVANWEKIVANMAVIADELQRTFVTEIEAVAGSAPAWFEPGD